MSAQFKFPKQELFHNRRNQWTLEIYEADRETEVVLAAGDIVRCHVWSGTDGDTPFVTVDSETPTANDSIITIDVMGTANTTPAQVTVVIEPDDSSLCTAGSQYMEITVARAADDTYEYPVGRAVVNVIGSPG